MKSTLCPKCQKPVSNTKSAKEDSSWPFCCNQCRDADLLDWLTEEYRIGRPLSPEELDEWLENHEILNPYDPNAF